MIPDRDTIVDIMQRVAAKDSRYREQFNETLNSPPFGAKRLTDDEWMSWFSTWLAENPWRLTWLPVIENGPEQLKRYKEIMGVDDAYGYLSALLAAQAATLQTVGPMVTGGMSQVYQESVQPPVIPPPAPI